MYWDLIIQRWPDQTYLFFCIKPFNFFSGVFEDLSVGLKMLVIHSLIPFLHIYVYLQIYVSIKLEPQILIFCSGTSVSQKT